MKSRHAAALALVGWYLMTPPCRVVSHWHSGEQAGGSWVNESQAPLRQWSRVADSQEFEHKTDCERAILMDEEDAKFAKCISSDDPGLKAK